MDASLVIRLIDQVSGTAQKVRSALQGIGEVAGGLKQGFGQAIRDGFSVQNIETATRNAEQSLERARGRLLGAFAMATSLVAPVVNAAQFDQSMRGLDKVLDVTTSRLSELRTFALETSALVPVAARDLVELMANAAQGGVPEAELEAFSLYAAKAAVAFDMAGAEIGDRFAKLRNVYKLNQQGIEQLGDASNHLSNNMAAKASELTDFANRAAGAANLFRLTAVQTTAVGAAMVAAGIAPETAARGFSALATKVTTGGKEIDAAFKSIGLNRKTFLKDLQSDAPKAIETLFRAMGNSPKGMDALVALVGMDFSDDFSKLMGNPELLAQAFRLVADANAYAGSASEEAAKQAEGAVKKWDLLLNKVSALAISIGDTLLPAALSLADTLGRLADTLRAFSEAHPELTKNMVMATAGLLGFAIASRVLAFGLAAVRLPLIGLASTFLKFDEAGKNVSSGWRVLSGAGRMLGGAFGLVKTAALAVATGLGAVSAPVWVVVAAVAAAGFAIWKYWDRISSFVSGFASAFSGIWDSIKAGAGTVGSWLADKIGGWLNLPPGQVDAFKASFAKAFDFTGLVDGAKQMLADFWSWLGSFFSQEKLSDAEKAEMHAAGQQLGESLINGIREFIESWITPIQDLFKFALEIEWPEPPEWLRWLMERSGSLLEWARETAAPVPPEASQIVNAPPGAPAEQPPAPAPGEAPPAPANGPAASAPAAPARPEDEAGVWQRLQMFAASLGGASPQGAPPPVAPQPPAGAAAGVAEPSGSWMSNLWNGLTGAGQDAGNGLAEGGQRGADALARGGQDAANELRSAARDINAAAAGLRSASASVRSGGGSVASAISGARTGALHGGTD
jgi:TP901 family phage tail tape measure protein